MKPINQEIIMNDDEFIVSKTDLKGNFTYANRTFMRMSQLSEEQLINKKHNIVRHPDMPKAVFQLLWRTIKREQEFFGFVKNISSDGRYYWVFANITPEYDQHDKLVGFLSVRRKPPTAAITAISAIYQTMIKIEQTESSSRAGQDKSIQYLESQVQLAKCDYQSFVINLFTTHTTS